MAEPMKPAPDEDLVEVARAFSPAEADVLQSLLESEGIRVLVRGRVPQQVYPFTVDGLAELKILVEAEDAESAKALIAAALSGPEGGEGGSGEPGPDDVNG